MWMNRYFLTLLQYILGHTDMSAVCGYPKAQFVLLLKHHVAENLLGTEDLQCPQGDLLWNKLAKNGITYEIYLVGTANRNLSAGLMLMVVSYLRVSHT